MQIHDSRHAHVSVFRADDEAATPLLAMRTHDVAHGPWYAATCPSLECREENGIEPAALLDPVPGRRTSDLVWASGRSREEAIGAMWARLSDLFGPGKFVIEVHDMAVVLGSDIPGLRNEGSPELLGRRGSALWHAARSTPLR